VVSLIRSSWQCVPMEGIGREWGSESVSPRCSLHSKNPASSRAAGENGGVLTSPESQTKGLSGDACSHHMSHLTYAQPFSESQPHHMLQRMGEQRCFAARWSSQQSGVGQPPPLSVGVRLFARKLRAVMSYSLPHLTVVPIGSSMRETVSVFSWLLRSHSPV
jgi:hypothetical protein